MQTYFAKDKNYNTKHAVAAALGNFDGLHVAHMKIINAAISYAKSNGMISMVYTFKSNSKNIIGKRLDAPIITTPEQKQSILKDTSLDVLYLDEFTPSLMKKSPEEFIIYLKDKLNVSFISVGYNYHFGYKATGDISLLKKLCDKYEIVLHVTEPVYRQNSLVSSSCIRTAIEQGNIKEANEMLGRAYFVTGIVTHGKRIGRQMGFPTVNTPVENMAVVPKFGVYVTHTFIDGVLHKSVTNVGIKPTVGTNELTIETYIIDFQEDLYGKNIQVDFLKWIRGEIKFSSFDELKTQISKDANTARCFVYNEEEKSYI